MHDPICTEDGDLEAALYGSFLPVPSNGAFPTVNPAPYSRENAPGAIVVKQDRIRINRGRKRIMLRVTNNGDRPIQVRHFSPSHCARHTASDVAVLCPKLLNLDIIIYRPDLLIMIIV